MEHHFRALCALVVSTMRGAGRGPDAEHHIRGIVLAVLGALEGYGAWFLAHIQAINSMMQFSIYAIALVSTLMGLRKVLRKS